MKTKALASHSAVRSQMNTSAVELYLSIGQCVHVFAYVSVYARVHMCVCVCVCVCMCV